MFWKSFLLSAWKGRGEKLFLESNQSDKSELFVGCTNRGRRIFWAFHCFPASSIIWVLQDCWGGVRKCQLMLCVLTIENQRTVFGQSLFASKLFFFTVLVSAKDEYEQYFLLGRKKDVECTEKISSVFMLVVLIDEENLLDGVWTFLQSFYMRTCIFVVVRTSSGRDSLYASFFFSRYLRNTHQDDLLGNKMIATVLSSWRIC